MQTLPARFSFGKPTPGQDPDVFMQQQLDRFQDYLLKNIVLMFKNQTFLNPSTKISYTASVTISGGTPVFVLTQVK